MKVSEELELTELTHFAVKHHPGFAQVPEVCVRANLLTYYRTGAILIFRVNDQLEYFAIYQEWPTFLNFLALVGKRSLFRIMWHILHNRDILPNKPIGFFDELRMEGRVLWQ